jgi:succinyl-CoA synthetase beta subunit
MIEINPLVRTESGSMVALDAKVSFDDNALFRHPEWENIRDLSEEEEIEVRAKETGLSYVKLDGDIGCMVNGAGLAMATMDVIKLYGGEPSNFLDVGGGANEDQVTTAFSIILEDPNVKGILVNIFGGIMRCDIIANGIIAAVGKLGLSDPLVVRLAGTNVDEGKAILESSGLNIHPADSLAEGAEKIVNLIQEAA